MGNTRLRSLIPVQTIDIRGKTCPYTLISTKKALGGVKSGEVLKVICDHAPAAEDTIPRYCEKEGYECESVKIDDKGYWEIYIRKP
ncbi:MAG: hypothetical protein Fur0020_12140 [Thermodesulfovibrionia bacterium]